MIRIVAINDESENSDEDEVQVSKEAEETIAVSEYVRALKLKKEHRVDDALSLLEDLLETQVLHGISKGHKDKTLFSVKYNCFKNIGFIYEELGNTEKALKYLLATLDLDDTDVFVMNKLGQLALSEKQYDIAHNAFEKCLKQNPNYWPAGDGILQILCERESYNEAYGWALVWYDKNSDYQRGLDVILEVREKFSGLGLDFIENCWSVKFKDTWKKRNAERNVFPLPSFDDVEPQQVSPPNIDKFKISGADDLNSWLKLGTLIVDMYAHFVSIDDANGISYDFILNDLLMTKLKNDCNENDENPAMDSNGNCDDGAADAMNCRSEDDVKNEDKENSNSNTDSGKFAVPSTDMQSADASAEDSDANKDSSDVPSKPKQSRRRGSGLQFLEQWCFWDRNRKYSQRRRNQQNDRPEIDNSIKGVLRKILPKYFEENFENEFPFDPEKTRVSANNAVNNDKNKEKSAIEKCPITNEDFQLVTGGNFEILIHEMKSSHFSLIKLMLEWTKNISKFWEKEMPVEIQDIYLKLYEYHLNHYDLSCWNQLDECDFQAAFRMALFYLELHLDRALTVAKRDVKNEVGIIWFTLYNHIIFHSAFYENSNDEVEASKYQKRIYWLQYCLAKYENDLIRTVNCLYTIKDLLNFHNESYRLDFQNQRQHNRIDMETVEKLIVTLERTISLNDVPRLYEGRNFDVLIDVLKMNLINLVDSSASDESNIRITTQIEVLLECFWSLDMFEECFIWAERCLAYSLDYFMNAAKDSVKQTEWAKNTSFVLTYIESLFINETNSIVSCLGRYYARLIQNIVRIVSHQLDTPFDKNNNNVHPIDIKSPWVIMHHILQREEDKTPKSKRKLSIESNATDATYEEVEETIPNSIMVFFTAHDYLGGRCWCTKDNGQLLLFALETVVTCLRTPYLESFRDIIAEYLEQMTYCLYGYPAKRARLKHIEEHDAQNIDLTWENAIQLFDLFRPDELPEFNSFKNDSITSEMEQLLQRVVALVPPKIDPSLKTEEICKFIAGQSKELPKSLDILPYRMQNIFYLLADYYFKNRDLTKSVKYYISDLANFSDRFDSWAGLALSKASILETKLNTCDEIGMKEFQKQAEEILCCFEQCIKLDDQIVLLWIEYGNCAYALHSYCSRNLKQFSYTLSMERFGLMEEKKEQCLKIAYDCFTTVDQDKNFQNTDPDLDKSRNGENSHDEKWLYHYMLGKISEKRKEQPNVILEHYVQSAKFLYESNATYPFRISFTNPQNLSLEALEIFYRVTATIIKYVEQHAVIPRGIGKHFLKILKEMSTSPFALSQAKINENSINAFKRKLSLANEEAAKAKLAKLEDAQASPAATPTEKSLEDGVETKDEANADKCENKSNGKEQAVEENAVDAEDVAVKGNEAMLIDEDKPSSPVRRVSQESTATNTTQTTTTTGSDSTSSSSSDSSSSDSSSSGTDDSSSEDDDKDENSPLSENDVEQIYKLCIKNLEECVTRFPEHYKSMYRLVHIYLYAPNKIRDLKKCKQLLLGTYTTALSNQIQGLFADRKGTNLFNGIWRNPSTEIDRPGSFSSHLSKCVNILMEILRIEMDHNMLLELVFHLQRTPEADKRYIKDSERKELLQQALTFCSQAFKDILKQHSSEKRNDAELLTLIVEIYKAHKKCLKNIAQKETVFSSLMVDTYKVYIQGKVAQLPENVSIMDLAVKLCQHEINSKNRLEKQGAKQQRLDESNTSLGSINNSKSMLNISAGSANTSTIIPGIPNTALIQNSTTPSTTSTSTTQTYIPGLSRPRGRPPGSKNVNSSYPVSERASATSLPNLTSLSHGKNLLHGMDGGAISAMMALYSNPSALMSSLTQFTDPASLKAFLAEYLKLANLRGMSSLLAGLPMPAAKPSTSKQSTSKSQSSKSQSPQTSVAINSNSSYSSAAPSLVASSQSKLPQLDIQSFFSSSSSVSTMTKSATTFSGGKPTATTIISVGSGELTITPSTSHMPGAKTSSAYSQQHRPDATLLKKMQQQEWPSKSTQKPHKRHSEGKESKKQKHHHRQEQTQQPIPTNLFADMPGISVTSVSKPINLPLDLPKSLSITPSPVGYNAPKPNQSSKPFVTMQAEKAMKPPKPKKQKTESWPKLVNASTLPVPGSIDIPDFNQQLAMFTQYNEILKSTKNKSYMSQFEQFLTYPTIPGQGQKPKSKHPHQPHHRHSPLQNLPQGLTINTSGNDASATASTSNQSKKGAISAKPMSMQQPHKEKDSSKLTGKYSIPDMNPITSTMLNPFAMHQPTAAHSSSSKKSILPGMSIPMSISSTNNQISPTKTLQQKLAERQKALNDANLLSSLTNSAGSVGSKNRKGDIDVIVLD